MKKAIMIGAGQIGRGFIGMELERAGYIVRNRLRDSKGKIMDVEYVIYETPHEPQPDTDIPHEDEPDTDDPYPENPDLDFPCLENPSQLNIDILSNQRSIKDLSITQGCTPFITGSPCGSIGGHRTNSEF